MISSGAVTFVSGCLASAGFTPKTEYIGDINERPSGEGSYYPAFMRVSRVELSEYKDGTTAECRAEVTVNVRLLGAEKGFSDAADLSEMCEEAVGRAYMSSRMIVTKAALGEFHRNMQLGRLERELCVTLSYIVTLTEVTA